MPTAPESVFDQLESILEQIESLRSQEGPPLSNVLRGAVQSIQSAQNVAGVKAFKALRAKVRGRPVRLRGTDVVASASISGNLTVT